MPFINRYDHDYYQSFDLMSKFLSDLNLTQEMVYPIVKDISGESLCREPETPSKGPVTSFGHRIPKDRVIYDLL